jgi:hypothetical protein
MAKKNIDWKKKKIGFFLLFFIIIIINVGVRATCMYLD